MASPRSSHVFQRRQQEPQAQPCAWPGCTADGVHRAPLSRSNLREYQFFCLEHIRDFNKSWNYFEGWNRDEIEHYQHDDLVWHRPTWRLGARAVDERAWADAIFHERIKDGFGFTSDDTAAGASHGGNGKGQHEHGSLQEDRRAFAILRLDHGADAVAVKRRFKEEVKLCHPDVNGGDKEAEERLRLVIWAYRHLTRQQAA